MKNLTNTTICSEYAEHNQVSQAKKLWFRLYDIHSENPHNSQEEADKLRYANQK